MAASASAERLAGDRLKPCIGVSGFQLALLGRGVEWTDASGSRYVGKLAIDRTIHASDRNTVIRRHQAVAGIDQPRLLRRLAREQFRHHFGADFGLGVGSEG